MGVTGESLNLKAFFFSCFATKWKVMVPVPCVRKNGRDHGEMLVS